MARNSGRRREEELVASTALPDQTVVTPIIVSLFHLPVVKLLQPEHV